MKKLLAAVTAVAAASLLSISANAADLVLYTSQPNEDAQATVDAFEAANSGIEVEWACDGTTKLMAKLQAEIEAENPVAEVLLIADTVTLQRMKEAGRLMAYKSPEAAHYDAAFAFATALTDIRGKRTLTFAFMLPMMIPPQITALAWVEMSGPASL